MKTVLAALVTVAMLATVAVAGYKPQRAYDSKPAVVKAAGSYGKKSGYAKGKTYGKSGKSTGYKSAGFKAGGR